jgi:asparagine synthase (glutamine-hydrolysing)
MCGINGIYHFDRGQNIDQAILEKMRDSMAHRGPDGKGIFIDANLGLGHRRLSIIDLSEKAGQPFISTDQNLVIILNGEIFNYRELRIELRSLGYTFRTESDTEVLLNMYRQYGENALEKLNGMFAFAIYDKGEKSLFIARDRIGIKPLYYSSYQNTFYFASEHKAILSAGVPSEIFEEGLNELLLFRYIAGENTIFKNIKRLLPGHSIMLKGDGTTCIKRWWNLPEKIRTNRYSLPVDPFKWFEENFYSSSQYRTISDVPVGIMLSGGLDSGCVAAALAHNGQSDMAAFTIAFDEVEYNEGHLAAEVSTKFGLSYHEIKVTGNELLSSLKKAAWFHDEPLVHQNDAQMLSLAEYSKEYVTVLLSGEGGDEFMGGYVRYKTLNHSGLLSSAGILAGWLKRFNTQGIVNRLDKLSRYAGNSDIQNLVILNASNIYPSDLKSLGVTVDMDQFTYRKEVYDEARLLYPSEPSRQAMYLDLFTHMASVLDRNDRMTMGAGIECRVPFMDYRLMEMIPALPSKFLLTGKKGKYLSYNSIGRQLPESVLKFKKLGFSVPWEKYFAEDEAFSDFISSFQTDNTFNIFKGLDTGKLIKGYHGGNTMSAALVRQLFMFKLWHETFQSNRQLIN